MMHDTKTVDGNGWSKHEHYVLSSLDRLEEGIQALSATIDKQNEDFTQIKFDLHDLKTKIGVWAIVIVAIGTVISPIISDLMAQYLTK